MLFNSFSFLFVFLPAVLFLYWKIASARWRQWVLVLSSYVFYSVWSAKFAALMLATTSVDYFTAQRIEDTPNAAKRKAWLAVSMVSNLGVLGVFKYYDFFVASVYGVFPHAMWPLLHLALPLGISFFTFESMRYTIDVYRREVRALRKFIDYAHFVTMFARLVAGPIVRYKDMARSLSSVPHGLEGEHVAEAVQMFTMGMAKKVLVADFLANSIVDRMFGERAPLTMSEAWMAALGYTAQLYFDFSGYSDMAVGLGLLLGFRLPRNFNLPYASANVSEFWRRWHISLSTWLRDYLYIPLGGNRGTAVRTAVNLFVTMLLGGLWHGASWTFVIWGAFHGGLLVLYNLGVVRVPWLPRRVAVALTFLAVVVGWVMFRATSTREAFHIYVAMVGVHGLGLDVLRVHAGSIAVLGVALGLSFVVDSYALVRPQARLRWAAVHGLIMAVCVTRLSVPSPFLYFQF